MAALAWLSALSSRAPARVSELRHSCAVPCTVAGCELRAAHNSSTQPPSRAAAAAQRLPTMGAADAQAAEMQAVDLYAARPVCKAEAACTPTLAACVAAEDAAAGARVTCRRLAPPLDACVLGGVLTPPECAALRREADALGYSFWTGAESGEARAFRNADTVEVTCPEVAAAVWARVAPHVDARVTFPDDDDDSEDDAAACERGLGGEWRACGVNPVLLFSRYGPGGHFSPHTDGNTVVGLNERSLSSMLLYLNDCADGGHTTLFAPPPGAGADAVRRFVRDGAARLRWPDDWVADAAPVREGSALLFRQHIPHEGAPVGPGCCKIIIRTDIMYRRTPPVCDDGAGREAYALYLRAGAAEAAGEAMAAMQLYRRSAKACPRFAQLMGLA